LKKYIFKPHSELFPVLFLKEKERIAAHLPEGMRIEHVGSTAVPGLGGKGIIDIAIGVDASLKQEIKIQLEELGYEFRSFFGSTNHLYCRIDLPDLEEGTRRYHLHLIDPGSEDWKHLIAFRDFLRCHKEAAEEYAQLKARAALEADQNGEIYRTIKDPFFKNMAYVELFNEANKEDID
jgi:GrpB-like predicted nucleotidyltransferase (UPF0157 family)